MKVEGALTLVMGTTASFKVGKNLAEGAGVVGVEVVDAEAALPALYLPAAAVAAHQTLPLCAIWWWRRTHTLTRRRRL